MIWSCQRESDGATGNLAADIKAELSAVAPECPGVAGEIAQAVEAFILEHHRNEALASEYVLLLIARALWAVGEEKAACRFIEAKGAEWRVAPSFVEAAMARDLSVPHWHALLGSRAVRSAATLARGAIWIIDLQRLMDAERGSLELTMLRVVHAVIDRIAGVWDHSRGQGILGLRHLDAAASALLGCSRRCRKSSTMAWELRNQCGVRLQSAGKSRGWTAIPEIISLDIDGT